MPGRYSIDGQDTNTAATSIISLGQSGSPTKRGSVYYVQLGSDATADAAFEGVLQRCTALGTSTAVTPQLLDSADAAAGLAAGEAHTVEPTYTSNAIVLSLSGHQRATVQWYAPPGGEIIIPSTASNGVGWQTITVTSAFNQVINIHYSE